MIIGTWLIKDRLCKGLYKCIDKNGNTRLFDLITLINMEKRSYNRWQ